jgi:hypothetical protein
MGKRKLTEVQRLAIQRLFDSGVQSYQTLEDKQKLAGLAASHNIDFGQVKAYHLFKYIDFLIIRHCAIFLCSTVLITSSGRFVGGRGSPRVQRCEPGISSAHPSLRETVRTEFSLCLIELNATHHNYVLGLFFLCVFFVLTLLQLLI